MAKKDNNSGLMPPCLFKQFKDKEAFQDYFSTLFKQGIEEMLQAKLDEHLRYTKHGKEGYNTGNSRNSSYTKKITTESVGDIVLNIPVTEKFHLVKPISFK